MARERKGYYSVSRLVYIYRGQGIREREDGYTIVVVVILVLAIWRYNVYNFIWLASGYILGNIEKEDW